MSDEKKKPSKVTAFELDGAVVGDVDAHPFTFGGFPGLWQVGRPMLPSALGLTVTRMRELIDEFALPLLEVQVHERDAFDTFEVPANHILSGPLVGDRPQPPPEMLEVNGELIPGPVVAGPTPELQPFAAEHIARNTKLLYPDEEPEVIADALGTEPGTEADDAALEGAGAED